MLTQTYAVSDQHEADEAKEHDVELLEAGEDSAVALEAAEQAFDLVATPVHRWKDRRLLAQAIKPIYTTPSAEAALAELDSFEQGAWGKEFPTVTAAWRRAWDKVIPFFAFPPAVRKVVYTTNAIESINARLRKIIKTRGHFPSDDATTKLIWLALRNIPADWGRAAPDWKADQFAILYADRFTKGSA